MSSDTPRTDAAIVQRDFGSGHIDWIPVAHARTLERELAGVRTEVERLGKIIDAIATAGGDEGASARMAMETVELRAALRIARETLDNIHITAHCLAKAGPLNTPTLQDAWVKFMDLEVMAVKGLSAIREVKL